MASTQVYATVAELRSRIERTRATDDAWLLQILTAASRSVDNACNRKDGFQSVAPGTARIFTGSGMPIQRIDECTSVLLVEVKDSITATTYTSWAATDWISFRGDPRSPQFNITPFDQLMIDRAGDYALFTGGASGGASMDAWFLSSQVPSRLRFNPRSAHGLPTVRVTAPWGYATVTPPEIREGTIMQSARWYKRYQSSMSDTLADGELGMLLYRQALDPDIRRILVDGRFVKRVVS